MGPRGLATAVLATLPLQMGLEGGEWIQEALFAVIPISIFLTAMGVFVSENEKIGRTLVPIFKKYPESLPLDTPSTENTTSVTSTNNS